MDRATDYRACMTPYMKGTGKTKEQRQIDMCAGAKICSGKAADAEEAARLCAEAAANPPKPRKSRGVDPAKLAACISTNINIEELTVDNLPARLESAINHCSMTKSASPPTYKRFMNACLKETGAGGDFVKAQSDIKKCQAKWNEKRGAQ